MKIFRVLTLTAGALKPVFQNQSELSYERSLQFLRSEGLMHPGSFRSAMEKLGNEVFEAIVDCLPLQKKWANENQIDATQLESIFLEQLRTFKPEVIYFERSGPFNFFSPSFRQRIRNQIPSVKLFTGLWGSAGVPVDHLSDIDHLFCMDRAFLETFRNHRSVEVCHHCFDDEMLLIPPTKKKEDIVFVGTSGYRYTDHKQRYLDLIWLMERSNLKAWVNEPPKYKWWVSYKFFVSRLLQKIPLSVLSKSISACSFSPRLASVFSDAIEIKEGRFEKDWFLHRQPVSELFPERASPAVFGREYLKLLGEAKIVLNHHVDAKEHYGNIRTFETCGMGSCLLTDRGSKMKHLFLPEEEIVSYSNREECLEKMKYLIDHPQECEKIAKKGRERIIREHLFSHRAQQIDATLRIKLKAV
jgi:spore maturation protein CgeB